MPEKTDSDEVDSKKAFEEGVGGEGEGSSSSITTSGSAEKSTEDVVDTLVPKSDPRNWHFTDGTLEKTYTQIPLSFFGKMQWFSLVGDVIDKAMAGEQGMKIGSLFEMPGGREGFLSASDFSDADTFVQAVGKLLSYAPDFLQKSYCIWLDVPDAERRWAINQMEKSLSDREGVEIIEVFIDQNWVALEDFFREEIGKIRDRVQAHRKTTSEEDQTTNGE